MMHNYHIRVEKELQDILEIKLEGEEKVCYCTLTEYSFHKLSSTSIKLA